MVQGFLYGQQVFLHGDVMETTLELQQEIVNHWEREIDRVAFEHDHDKLQSLVDAWKGELDELFEMARIAIDLDFAALSDVLGDS